jgi:hypothetical protein
MNLYQKTDVMSSYWRLLAHTIPLKGGVSKK